MLKEVVISLKIITVFCKGTISNWIQIKRARSKDNIFCRNLKKKLKLLC